jgi:hypothetical protein
MMSVSPPLRSIIATSTCTRPQVCFLGSNVKRVCPLSCASYVDLPDTWTPARGLESVCSQPASSSWNDSAINRIALGPASVMSRTHCSGSVPAGTHPRGPVSVHCGVAAGPLGPLASGSGSGPAGAPSGTGSPVPCVGWPTTTLVEDGALGRELEQPVAKMAMPIRNFFTHSLLHPHHEPSPEGRARRPPLVPGR